MVCLLKEHPPPPPSSSIGALQRAQQLSPPRRREAQQVYLKATRKESTGQPRHTDISMIRKISLLRTVRYIPSQRAYISYPLTLWNENHCNAGLSWVCSFDVCIKKVLLLKIVKQVTLNYLSRSDTAKMCLQSGS